MEPRIDPRTSSLTAQFITHFSNLSFCQLFYICLCLSDYLFSLFCLVPRLLFSLDNIRMLKLCSEDYYTRKIIFSFLQPKIGPRTSSLTARCITHCSNLSFCQLFYICLCLSNYLFSLFCLVPRLL